MRRSHPLWSARSATQIGSSSRSNGDRSAPPGGGGRRSPEFSERRVQLFLAAQTRGVEGLSPFVTAPAVETRNDFTRRHNGLLGGLLHVKVRPPYPRMRPTCRRLFNGLSHWRHQPRMTRPHRKDLDRVDGRQLLHQSALAWAAGMTKRMLSVSMVSHTLNLANRGLALRISRGFVQSVRHGLASGPRFGLMPRHSGGQLGAMSGQRHNPAAETTAG